MPADDSLFEKALARQLGKRTPVAGEARDGETPLRAENIAQSKFCPDAEILAAYHERLLGSDEMGLWREHIVSCRRCQEILAQLEGTEDILVTASERETGTATGDIAGRGVGIPVIVRPSAFAVAQTVVIAKPGRRSMRYWVVPGGAIAAGLLVWIGMHEHSKDIFSKTDVQIAENRQASPPPSAAKPVDGPGTNDDKVISEQKIPVGASGASNVAPVPEKKKVWPDLPAQATPAPRISSGDTLGGKRDYKSLHVYPSAHMPTGKVAGGANADAGQVPGGTTQSVEVASEAATSQVQANGAPQANGRNQVTTQLSAAPAVAAPELQSAQDTQLQTSTTQAAAALLGAQSEAVTVNNSPRLRAVSRAQNPRMIPAPGGNLIWRVGKSGLIEQSANAGGIWTQQNSGVTVTLESGSAPSATVCWIVGRAGTILHTIDGGGHWTKIISPLTGDIGGILAADADHATIWDVAKKNNFITADGGVSWTRVANP